MMIEHFNKLFRYDSDVNAQVLERLRAMSAVPARMRSVFCHLLAAKQVWMLRLHANENRQIEIWPDLSWDECEALISKNRADYATYLSSRGKRDLESSVTYRNSKGVEYRSRVQDILQHVLLHSAYHRGQIAQSMRQEGTEPVVTDYIFYVREGE